MLHSGPKISNILYGKLWNESYRWRQFYEAIVLHDTEVTLFLTALNTLETDFFKTPSSALLIARYILR